MTRVRYLDTPIDLFIELQEGLDAFQREAQISDFDDGEALDDVVVEGLVGQRDELVDVRVRLLEQAMAARAAGHEVADLEADYPDGTADRVRTVVAGARRADEVAQDGRLLSPPFRPELRHFRDWVFSQVLEQIAGGAPSPYRTP